MHYTDEFHQVKLLLNFEIYYLFSYEDIVEGIWWYTPYTFWLTLSVVIAYTLRCIPSTYPFFFFNDYTPLLVTNVESLNDLKSLDGLRTSLLLSTMI